MGKKRSLTTNELEYINTLWTSIRNATRKASEASKKWNARKEYLNNYCFVNNYTAEQSRAKAETDWGLNDAFSEWNFWQQEATRLSAAMAAEGHARRLLKGQLDE